MMNFESLITKYQKLLSCNLVNGSYVKGKWVETKVTKQFMGTLLPFSPEELQMVEAGTYTTEDRKLFIRCDLKDTEGNVLLIKDKDIIVDNDIEYEVTQQLAASNIVNYKKFICKKKVVK